MKDERSGKLAKQVSKSCGNLGLRGDNIILFENNLFLPQALELHPTIGSVLWIEFNLGKVRGSCFHCAGLEEL